MVKMTTITLQNYIQYVFKKKKIIMIITTKGPRNLNELIIYRNILYAYVYILYIF